MANVNDYVWKHNGPRIRPDDTSVRFSKPLRQGNVFADLRNGRTFIVTAISAVKEPAFKDVPKEILHTSDAKPIPKEQLMTLRDEHKLDEDPDWPYLILP
jgi:hypothetical protein